MHGAHVGRASKRGRYKLHMREQYLAGIAFIRQFSGQHLVQDDAQHVDVAQRTYQALKLFGGHIRDGAENARFSHHRRVLQHFCQPEIHEGKLSITANQQVVGFDIAMDDALFVRIIQG